LYNSNIYNQTLADVRIAIGGSVSFRTGVQYQKALIKVKLQPFARRHVQYVGGV